MNVTGLFHLLNYSSESNSAIMVTFVNNRTGIDFFCLSEFLSMQNNKQGWKTFSVEMQICKFAYYVLTNLLVHGFTLKVLCWIIRRKRVNVKHSSFSFRNCVLQFWTSKIGFGLKGMSSVFKQFCQKEKSYRKNSSGLKLLAPKYSLNF